VIPGRIVWAVLLAGSIFSSAGQALARPQAPDAPPVITDNDPLTLPADHGASDVIELFGQNFQNNSEVRLGTLVLSSTFKSGSQLDFNLPTGAEMRTAGVYSITVFTPGAGNGTSNATPFTITAGSLFTLTVLAQPSSGNASTARVSAGRSAVFTARGTDRYANLTATPVVTWTASAGVTLSPATGVSTTVLAGQIAPLTATITATAQGNVITATGRLIVNAPQPTTISLTVPGNSLAIDVGQTRTVTASVLDESGVPITNTAVVFGVSNPAIATIESSGPLTAVLRAGTSPAQAITMLSAALAQSPTLSITRVIQILTPTVSVDLGPALLRSETAATAPVTVSLAGSQSGARLGEGIPVSLTVRSSAGQCGVAPANGTTDSLGTLTAQLTCTGIFGAGSVAITVTAAYTGVPRASGEDSGVYAVRPLQTHLPYVQGIPRLVSGNIEACAAFPLTADLPVFQSASDRFVFYEVAPVNGTLTISVRDFPASGRYSLYKIINKNCPGTVNTVETIKPTPFSAPGITLLQTGLDRGARYILIIQNTGDLSAAQFTVVYRR
jgi:hypothetical protein